MSGSWNGSTPFASQAGGNPMPEQLPEVPLDGDVNPFLAAEGPLVQFTLHTVPESDGSYEVPLAKCAAQLAEVGYKIVTVLPLPGVQGPPSLVSNGPTLHIRCAVLAERTASASLVADASRIMRLDAALRELLNAVESIDAEGISPDDDERLTEVCARATEALA